MFSRQCLLLTKPNDSVCVSCLYVLFEFRKQAFHWWKTQDTVPGEERVGMHETRSKYSVITSHQPGVLLGSGRPRMNELLAPSR